MTTQQEIKTLLKDQSPWIVDKHVKPEIINNICHWTGELMKSLTTLSPDDSQEEKDIAANAFHDGIVEETIKQLQVYLQKKKKLSK